jgi:hypothetical protein
LRKITRAFRIGAGVAICALLAGVLFYLSFLRGKTAHASPVPDLLAALPGGAPTLLYLDLAAIRASSFYQHRSDKGPIALPNQDYADFVRSTGFDFEKDLDRVAAASWPAPSGKEPRKSVVIAEGRFDRAKIRDYAMHQGKIEQQRGHEVFLFPASDHAGTNSVTFLDDHRLALVAGPSIALLFAGNSGDPATDPARERAARLDGAAMFLISLVPAIPDQPAAPGAAGVGTTQLLSMARSIRWVTVAARPEGDDLRLSVEGDCDTSTDAMEIKSALELLRMFGRASLDSPKTTQSMSPAALAQLQKLLTSAEVTQSAERVRILVELTPEVFKLGEASKAQ